MKKKEDIHLEIAKKAYKQDQWMLAIKALKSYLKRNSKHAYAWYLLGDSLRIIGRKREAKAALFKALDLNDPKGKSHIYSTVAALFDDMGQYSEALRWYNKLEKDKEYAKFGWFWILKGGCYAKLEKFAKAETCHRKAITLPNVDLDEAYLNLGYVLRVRSKYKESKKAFQKALKFDPKNKDAKEGLISLEGV